MQHFSMFYESYPAPDNIKCDDWDHTFDRTHSILKSVFQLYFPWAQDEIYDQYLYCVANVRMQDYGFIKNFSNLASTKLKHLDIGPGLGSHSLYSQCGFESLYCGLEAFPESYQVQRNFLRSLALILDVPYLDFVAAENFGVDDTVISEMLRERHQGIVQVPSWKLPVLDNGFFDLVTASWVLNEINDDGVMWLISGVSRTLKIGGCFYIRDSGKPKPGRNNIDYDTVLQDIGFEQIGRLNVQNRVDFHGTPRIYQKTDKTMVPTFEEMVDRVLGHFGISAQYGGFNNRLG